ncbi:hypothetical protein ACFLZJ_00475 [Nanoarchaeota archaeon]
MERAYNNPSLFMGLAFIVLLIICVLIVIGQSSATTAPSTAQTTITYNYNYNYEKPEPRSNYVTYVYDRDDLYYDDYYRDRDKYYDDYDYLRYDADSDHDIREDMFGNRVDDFQVWVENRDHKSGYFTVKFYFTDYYGDKDTESVTHYIKAGDEKKFLYRDIHGDRDKYRRWEFKVTSETERPEYNYDYDRYGRDYRIRYRY